jgi:hypothetical protein
MNSWNSFSIDLSFAAASVPTRHYCSNLHSGVEELSKIGGKVTEKVLSLPAIRSSFLARMSAASIVGSIF